MDTERAGNSIDEGSCTTIVEELIDGPFHSDHSLDGISWSNLELAALGEVELKNVLDTNVSVLTAVASRDLAVHANVLIPLVHVHSLAILENLS